jgi:non-ribosomal peptide synthetase component E (peptide arylation enzyme)
VLERHPEVSQAVAVGYPDRLMGERVCAFVVATGAFDLDVCRAWFTAQGVTPFKTPERIEVVDALPVLASGKPDRAALRARAARPDR